MDTKKLRQIEEMIKESEINFSDSSVIKDNNLIFPIDADVYRIKMPSPVQTSKAETIKNEHYVALLQSDHTLTKKKLKEVLKKKQGIDIVALEKTRDSYQTKVYDFYMELAKVDNKKEVNKLKEKILEFRSKHLQAAIEITEYLSPCIEYQIQKKYIEYLAYLCTERLLDEEKDEWERVWNSFDKFESDNGKLANRVVSYMSDLLINVINL